MGCLVTFLWLVSVTGTSFLFLCCSFANPVNPVLFQGAPVALCAYMFRVRELKNQILDNKMISLAAHSFNPLGLPDTIFIYVLFRINVLFLFTQTVHTLHPVGKKNVLSSGSTPIPFNMQILWEVTLHLHKAVCFPCLQLFDKWQTFK